MPQLLHFLNVDRKTKLDRAIADAAMRDAQAKAEAAARAATQPADGTGSAAAESASVPVPDPHAPSEVDTDNLFCNEAGEDIDWGTLDVYTCTASCPGSCAGAKCGSAYVEELVLMQPPLGLKTTKQSSDS
jgi:hypothetical protein